MKFTSHLTTVLKFEVRFLTYRKHPTSCGMRFNFGIQEIYYYGISGNFMQLVKSFLENCKQRVVLNGQASSWSNVQTGASQGYSWSNFFLNLYL